MDKKTIQTRIRNAKNDKTDITSGGAGSYANSPYNQKNTFTYLKRYNWPLNYRDKIKSDR